MILPDLPAIFPHRFCFMSLTTVTVSPILNPGADCAHATSIVADVDVDVEVGVVVVEVDVDVDVDVDVEVEVEVVGGGGSGISSHITDTILLITEWLFSLVTFS